MQPLSLYSEYVDNPYNMSTIVVQMPSAENQGTDSTDVINRNSANLEGDYNTNVFQSSSYFTNESNVDLLPAGSENLFDCDKTERQDSCVCDSANIPFIPSSELKTTTT